LDARLTPLLCKKITVAKSRQVKTGSNLAESSKEGYGSKRAVLPMVMMMIVIYQ
jgi:spore maturation protein SpmB